MFEIPKKIFVLLIIGLVSIALISFSVLFELSINQASLLFGGVIIALVALFEATPILDNKEDFEDPPV
jgi:hypothetical protein